MIQQLLIVFFIFGSTLIARAEDPAESDPLTNIPHVETPVPVQGTTVFETFEQPGLVRTFVELPIYSFYLGAPNVNGAAYVPDTTPRLGLQLGWKEFSASASLALPLPDDEKDRRGNTTGSSFIFSKYWHQWAVDAYYQKYVGFYLSSPFTELDSNKPARYPQLPNAVVSNYGVTGYYAMDPDHYSLSAAFSQIEFQSFSGSSWVINPFYNHVELATGTVFISGTDANAQKSLPDVRSTLLDTLGCGLAYGSTWVKDRGFITAQGGVGIGVQTQQIEWADDVRSQGANIAVQMNLNIAAGYNYKVYNWGVKGLANSLLSDVKGTQIDSTLIQGQIFFGGRF